MSTAAISPLARPITPDLFERVLAGAAVILLAAVVAALFKGRHEWGMISVVVWGHLLMVTIAVALTPVMLLRRRGDRLHRKIGWVWAVAMIATALGSFAIRDTNDGAFSFIHLLSLFTLVQVPLIVWSARVHNVRAHRGSVRGMVTGALLVAGFFTFPFNRLLGHWLFG